MNVNRGYVNKLMERHNVLATLPEKYLIFSLPTHMVMEKYDNTNLNWNDVELLLSMFTPHIAKEAITQKYGFCACCHLLHCVVIYSFPRHLITKILEVAPKAARL